jgi:uncharacterized integral membrane protein
MKHIIWLLKWLFKAAIFFTVFAFALNNQQDITVHFFFGTYWRAPAVIVLMAFFASGLVLGIAALLPRIWLARQARPAHSAAPPVSPHGH